MEAAPARKGFLPTVRETFLVVLDDDEDINSVLHAVEGEGFCKQLLILKQVLRVHVQHRRRRSATQWNRGIKRSSTPET